MPSWVLTDQATVVPSGEMATEVGVLVWLRLSISEPIRGSLGIEEVASASARAAMAVPNVENAVKAIKPKESEHLRRSAKAIRKA